MRNPLAEWIVGPNQSREPWFHEGHVYANSTAYCLRAPLDLTPPKACLDPTPLTKYLNPRKTRDRNGKWRHLTEQDLQEHPKVRERFVTCRQWFSQALGVDPLDVQFPDEVENLRMPKNDMEQPSWMLNCTVFVGDIYFDLPLIIAANLLDGDVRATLRVFATSKIVGNMPSTPVPTLHGLHDDGREWIVAGLRPEKKIKDRPKLEMVPARTPLPQVTA